MEVFKSKERISSGIIYAPYTLKTTSTSVNGEIVWYANKWKNLLLKIKHFFIKPKCFKKASIYSKTLVNPAFYEVVRITNNSDSHEVK